MLVAKAEGRYIRISPSKVRLVTALIKGKSVEQAGYVLENVNKIAGNVLKKILDSAFANANFNKQEKYKTGDLKVSLVKADIGPMYKRFRAATMGRAIPIRHRTAHIYMELEEMKMEKKEPKVKKKAGSK